MKTLLCCALAALLAACSAITRAPAVRQTFLIEPAPLSAVTQSQPGALRVGTISVAAPFRGKSFVFRIDELRYETDYYDEFLVTPASMLTDQTARALVRARLAVFQQSRRRISRRLALGACRCPPGSRGRGRQPLSDGRRGS